MAVENRDKDTGRPGPADGPAPDPRRVSIRWVMLLVAAAAVLIRIGVAGGAAFCAILFVAVVISAVVASASLFLKGVSIAGEPMLWVVANAAERRLPVEPGIEACGALCGGAERRRTLSVVRAIERGAPLADALEWARGSFPTTGLIFIRMGWDADRLAGALRDLIRSRAEWRPFRSSVAFRIVYLGWTLLVAQSVMGFMAYWIMPKFEEIFSDFGVELPGPTRWMIGAADLLVASPLAVVIVPLVILGFVMLPLAFFDPLHWGYAPIDRLLIRRHGALVLRVLAGEVEMGRPLSSSLARLERAYPSGTVRRRLRRAATRISKGRPWARTLADVGLIGPADAAVLEAAEKVGNLDWALRDLSEALERRFGLRMLAWTQLLFPAAILAIGAVVFVYALAYFLPLVTLIRELTF